MSPLPCSCCDYQLERTEVAHHLFDVFRKWELHGIKFSSDTLRDYPDDMLLTLYRCNRCGFGIFLPLTIGTYSFYADITRNEYYLEDRWDFHVACKALRSAKARSVLDVGCGRGAFLNIVLNQLPSVICHGNDANPVILDDLPNGVILHSNLADAPVGLDAVTLFQVIEHVEDPVNLLTESITKVRRGGLVVVSVPDHSGPIRFFADSHTAVPPHHLSIWTPTSLEALLSKLDLTILSRRKEPLPDYLMPYYLPKILANAFGLTEKSAWEELLTNKLSRPIVGLCKSLGIRNLPISGHTFLIVAKTT